MPLALLLLSTRGPHSQTYPAQLLLKYTHFSPPSTASFSSARQRTDFLAEEVKVLEDGDGGDQHRPHLLVRLAARLTDCLGDRCIAPCVRAHRLENGVGALKYRRKLVVEFTLNVRGERV